MYLYRLMYLWKYFLSMYLWIALCILDFICLSIFVIEENWLFYPVIAGSFFDQETLIIHTLVVQRIYSLVFVQYDHVILQELLAFRTIYWHCSST